ncbi:MAG: TrmH family RNA methyltransferase [Pseudomonadota bacterium]
MANTPVALALYQPDMAANVGAILRLGACLGAPVHIIEPCGFAFSARAWARTAMDYAALATIHRHSNWTGFETACTGAGARVVALTAHGACGLWDFAFRPGDRLLLGRESAGLPEAIRAGAAARLRIPLVAGARSLNIAVAAAIALAEAQRQIAAR